MLHNYLLQYSELTKEQRRELFFTYRSCLICKGKSKKKRLVVDHCHESGYCRGILCERCNSWLGVLEGKRSKEKKQEHLEKIERKYGIPPKEFRQYLKKTKYLKRKTKYTVENVDFEPKLTVYLKERNY